MSEGVLTDYRHKLGRTLRRSRVGRVVYESARRLRGEIRVALHAWRAGVLTHAGRPDADLADRQRPLRWTARLPSFDAPGELRDWLTRQGIAYSEGRHTFYLPPQSGLAGLFPAASFYPADAGFKILKDPGSPDESRYVGAAQTTILQTRLTGSPYRQVLAAGYLAMHGIGPAIYDLAEITTAGGQSLTAFVVQDAGRDVPTMDEYGAFMHALEERLQSGELAVIPPNWRQRGDFSAPDCARNLVKSSAGGAVRYIDFQQFLVTDQRLVVRRLLEAASGDLHFGTAYAARGGKYPYQSVPIAGEPAKRDTQIRWRMMAGLLRRYGIDPELRIFFDVGCNAGMMLAEALAAGARWGVGWDLPRVAGHARRLQLALGNTRLDLIGARLDAEYPLAGDVPERLRPFTEGAVVFYLAVRQHLGFMPALAALPWRYLLYEGHQGESADTIPLHMNALAAVVPIRVIDTTAYADGDSRLRPVALVERVG